MSAGEDLLVLAIEPTEMEAGRAGTSPFDGLPGHPLMWVLILSELLVFGAFLLGTGVARLADPAGYATAQSALDGIVGGLNTLVLIASGWCAARATLAARLSDAPATRCWLIAAALLGTVFLVLKLFEYAEKDAAGIGFETATFFTLYYLITGFHAAHVVLGLFILLLCLWRREAEVVETGVAFWHMVDLIWLIVYPVLYLLR